MSKKRSRKTTVLSIAGIVLAFAGAASATWAAYDDTYDAIFFGISSAFFLAATVTNIFMIRSRRGDKECAS